MHCYNPLHAYRYKDGSITFHEKPDADALKLPCGQCVGCRLDRSRQWAIRCLHEAKMHQDKCFLTLTYDDKHLPRHANLQYRDFQLFMKRLRRRRTNTLRFYACGEYGEKTERPHYHLCLFGTDFQDKRYHSKTPSGDKLYTSTELNEIWQQGHALIGNITFESAAYVARYIMKKITGNQAKEHYKRIDKDTGEIYNKTPEFNKMSLKPAIGKTFLTKYWNDIFPQGTVISRGHEVRAPRYYEKILKKIDPQMYEELLKNYDEKFSTHEQWEDNTPDRLKSKETVTQAKVNLLKRTIE